MLRVMRFAALIGALDIFCRPIVADETDLADETAVLSSFQRSVAGTVGMCVARKFVSLLRKIFGQAILVISGQAA